MKSATISSRTYVLVAAAVVSLGLVIRLIAMRDGFWFDEIWSWLLAQRADSLGDVLLRTRYDNNHPLNTLWIYLIGNDVHWIWYRLPALVFGVATIMLVGRLTARQLGRGPALTAMLIFSSSMLMVEYTTEARGYAPLVFFGVLAYDLTERWFNKQTWQARLSFLFACVGGILSHATFVVIVAALLVWALAAKFDRQTLMRTLHWFLVPGIAVVSVYGMSYWNMVHLTYAGPFPVSQMGLETIAGMFGVSESHVYGLALAVLVAVLCLVTTLPELYRQERRTFFFYAALIIAFIALMLAGSWGNGMWRVRYGILPVAFLYLLLNKFLWLLPRRSPYGLAILSCLLSLFVSVNALSAVVLKRDIYRDVFLVLAAQAAAEPASLSSNDYFVPFALRFYEQYLPEDTALSFSYYGVPEYYLQMPVYDASRAEAQTRIHTDSLPAWYLHTLHRDFPHVQPALNLGGEHYAFWRSFRDTKTQADIVNVYRRVAGSDVTQSKSMSAEGGKVQNQVQ